ncbi:MAG: cytochrome-c peroxidase [Chromatiales bacterium]|nr:cytochrome-c peroxidase [Chromatiales bacterium]
MGKARILIAVAATILLGSSGWFALVPTPNVDQSPLTHQYIPQASNQPIVPIPQFVQLDSAKVKLGRKLFHDTRLSKDNTIACSSCHDLHLAGQDGRPVSLGVDDREGTMNSPSVYNSAFNFRQFWDGRAVTLEEQVSGPLHDPAEMATDWQQVESKLNQDKPLVEQFEAIWDDGITPNNIQSAIAEFERSLITPNAIFDRYLRGELKSLTPEQQEGWNLFRDLGCITCHQGINIGGNMFANMGVMGEYFADRKQPIHKHDLGRFNVTGDLNDKHVFKVPSLRNVMLTAPYFHDGSVASLEEAIDIMAHYQTGVQLSTEQRDKLIAFLQTLTGEYREHYEK